MTQKSNGPVADVEFDDFGRYDIAEISDDDLDAISGGGNNVVCPNAPGCVPNPNFYCPSTPPPPPPAPTPKPPAPTPPPKPNQSCGEDGDGE